MNISDLMAFICPQMDDLIQAGFFIFIFGLVIVAALCPLKWARPSSWEKKWNRNTPHDPSDDLDFECGSVTDLWQAVATKSEKVAGIMPGMLLVIGLLGTFLGLGMALNSAGNILSPSDGVNAGTMARSMRDLTNMLHGLGTKFKTSTWGIIGFLLLSFWNGFLKCGERRMSWVIDKVKVELGNHRRAKKNAEDEKNRILLTQVAAAADHVVAGLAEHIGSMLNLKKEQHQQQLEHFDDIIKELSKIQTETSLGNANSAKFGDTLLQEIKNAERAAATRHQQRLDAAEKSEITFAERHQQQLEHFDYIHKDLSKIHIETSLGNANSAKFGDTLLQEIKNVELATATRHKHLLDTAEKSEITIAERHQQQLEHFDSIHNDLSNIQIETILGNVNSVKLRDKLLQEIENAERAIATRHQQLLDAAEKSETTITERHHQHLERLDALKIGLGGLHTEMNISRNAMENFSHSTFNVVKSMADEAGKIGAAADRMGPSAIKVGEAADSLVSAVDRFSIQFSDVLETVRTDLSQVLGDVSKSLEKAITDMSGQASETLKKGSAQLSAATEEISKALGDLSRDVNTTMATVEASIKDTQRMQLIASTEFTTASHELKENIATSTNIVDNLAEPIRHGLSAISASNREVISVGKSMTASVSSIQDVAKELHNLPVTLQHLTPSPKWHQEIISALAPLAKVTLLSEQLQALLEAIKPLGFSHERHSDVILAITPLQQLVSEVQELRGDLITKQIALSHEQHNDVISAITPLQKLLGEIKGLRSDLISQQTSRQQPIANA